MSALAIIEYFICTRIYLGGLVPEFRIVYDKVVPVFGK